MAEHELKAGDVVDVVGKGVVMFTGRIVRVEKPVPYDTFYVVRTSYFDMQEQEIRVYGDKVRRRPQ